METSDMLDPEALLRLPETARKGKLRSRATVRSDLTASAMRTDAIVQLMRSLPRHQLSDVHSELTAYLKRDILGVGLGAAAGVLCADASLPGSPERDCLQRLYAARHGESLDLLRCQPAMEWARQ